MEQNSPFRYMKNELPKINTTIIHINFCNRCHHVWKAPIAAQKCINCVDGGNPESLKSYINTIPIT